MEQQQTEPTQPKRPEKPKPLAKPQDASTARKLYEPGERGKEAQEAPSIHHEENTISKEEEHAAADAQKRQEMEQYPPPTSSGSEKVEQSEEKKDPKKTQVPRLDISQSQSRQNVQSTRSNRDAHKSRVTTRPSTQQSPTERSVTTGHPVEQKHNMDTLEQLQSQNESFIRKIEMEKRRADELERKLKISKLKLDEVRKSLRGRDTREESRRLEKNIKVCEKRLDLARKRFNERVAQNEDIKKEIESLRKDKLQRENIVSKTQRDVEKKREEIEKLKEELRKHNEVKDKCEKDIQHFQVTIDQEAEEFQQRFQEALEENAQVNNEQQQQLESEDSMDEEALFKQLASGNAGLSAQQMTLSQEATLRHKSAKHAWENAKREVEQVSLSQELDAFETAFANIQDQTGISSIDEMVEAFQVSEESNYSQINMINELNKEIKELEVENSRLRSAVGEAEKHGTITDESRRQVYDEAEKMLQNLEKGFHEHERQNEKALRQLEIARPGVHSIFQKLCSSSDDSLTESLAATGVSDGNIMQFLGIIEQRVEELTYFYELTRSGQPLSQIFDQVSSKETEEDHGSPRTSDRIGGTSMIPYHNPSLKTPRIPSTQEICESEDAEGPLSYRSKLQQQKTEASHLSRARESAQTIFASSAGLTNNPEGLNSSLKLLLDPSGSGKKMSAADKAANLDPIVSRKGRGLRSTEQAAREDVVKILRGDTGAQSNEVHEEKGGLTGVRPVSVAELRTAMHAK